MDQLHPALDHRRDARPGSSRHPVARCSRSRRRPPRRAQRAAGDLGSLPEPAQGAAPLTFGIYPGGLAGQIVGPPAEPKPDDPAKILDALDQLRGGPRPFVLHLYLEWNGTDDQEERVRAAEELIGRYTAAGYAVEYVLTYRPRARRGEPDVRDFVAFTRAMVAPPGPAAEGDPGDERGEQRPLARRVRRRLPGRARRAAAGDHRGGATRSERQGLGALEIGMNWFYRLGPDHEYEFWTELGREGRARSSRVRSTGSGLDAYPGTFFPPGLALPRVDGQRDELAARVLHAARRPRAATCRSTSSRTATRPAPAARSPSRSARCARWSGAVHDFRGNYGVTDYRWFDLRDGDSSNPNFGQQYGLMLDDYTPKPAFGAYRELIARARPAATAEPAGDRQILASARARVAA